MRSTAGLVIMALLAAGSCRAQTADDAGRCAVILRQLEPYLAPASQPALAKAGPDSCVFKGARVRLGHDTFAVGAMVVDGGAAPDGPLVHRHLELRDVAQLVQTADADANWVPREQVAPLKVVLDTTEDRTNHTLTVNELSIEGNGIGRVSIDGMFEKVGAGTIEAGMPDLSGAGLRSLHVRVDSKGFVSTFLMPVLMASWGGADPTHEMAAFQLQASDMTQDSLHMMHPAPGTADAVLAFIHELPKPQHVLDVSMTVKGDPVTADDVDGATGSMMGMAELLSSLKVKATYTGDAH